MKQPKPSRTTRTARPRCLQRVVRPPTSCIPHDFDIMESLRNAGWLVVLKCLPDMKPWLCELSEGRYEESSRRKWCCEAQWLGGDPWRHSQTAFAHTPREAIVKVFALIADDDARRYNDPSSPTGAGAGHKPKE